MKHEEFLQELLQRTKRRLKVMELGAGAVTFLAVLVASLTLGVILDHAFALPKVARWAILLALDASIAVALLAAAVFLLRRLNDVFVARLIERLDPGFRNTLVATIEARRLPDIPAGIREFIEEQAAEKATRVDPLLAVSPRRLVVASYALLLAFLFFFFYSFFTHKSVLVALERIWEPGADIAPATATQIVSVEPASRAVLATNGASLPVVVRLRGVIPKRVTLQWSREQELWGSLELTSAKDGRQWETALGDLERDLFYSIQAGDARSPVYHLHVVPIPLVTSLQTQYRFPDYAGLPERVTYRGDVDALDGTVITVQAHTNTTLAQAELLVNDVAVAATVHQPQPGEEPGDTVEGSFTVSRGGFYSIRLTDPFGFTNPDPVRYEVVCRYDQPPAVHILEPRGGVRMAAEHPLALTFEATDDLGLGSLQFHYKLPQEREERSESLPLPANVREVHDQITVHLDRLGLEPGQTLACYLQALDTFPEQPHVGRSETLVVAVPLPGELTEAYAQAAGPAGEPSEAKPGEQAVPAVPATAAGTAQAPPAEGQEAENQEPTLEKMLARDQTVIDTIRQSLAEDAQAQAAQPGGQPGPPTGQGATTSQGAASSQGAPTGQGASAATQANTGATGTGGPQPAAAGQANPQAGGAPPAGQPNPQAPAGAAASTPPAPPTPPVTVWPTGEVGEPGQPGQTPLAWPSEVSAASGGAGAVQPAANAQLAAGATPNPASAATSQPGAPASGAGQSSTPAGQTAGAQPGQGAQSGQTQAQAGGQQAPSGAAASTGAQGGQQAPSGGAATTGAQGGQQASSQGSASGQPQGGQGNAQGQSSAGQAGAQPGGQPGSQANQSASQGGAQTGAQSGGQGGAQPGGQAQAGAAAQSGAQGQSGSGGQPGAGQPSSGGQPGSTGQPGGAGQPGSGSQPTAAGQQGAAGQSGPSGQPGSGGQPASASSSSGGGSPNPAPGSQQGPAEGETQNPSQTLHPAGGGSGPSGGGGGGTSGTQAPDLTVGAAASTPEGERQKLEVVGQVIDQLYDRLLRNNVNPKLLEQLNWSLPQLAAWVADYKAKLNELPKEQRDAGVLLGGEAAGLPGPEQRVIEMGKQPLDVKRTVGEGTAPISPDEVAQLLQGAKGTVSPEYRTLLEDYYRALADTARK